MHDGRTVTNNQELLQAITASRVIKKTFYTMAKDFCSSFNGWIK